MPVPLSFLDQARPVREGEGFDPERLRSFLCDKIPGLAGGIALEQFPKGYSNLTYLVRVGDREMVLRRPPFGRKARTAHDMSREYLMLTALRPVFRYCPAPLAACDDESVIGGPFYVMERMRGIILREQPPEGLSLPPATVGRLAGRMIDVWCELHAVDWRAAGLSGIARPEGYVQRQVEGWSRRYREARTPDAPDCEAVMTWLAANRPPDTDRPCLIHNDYKFDNLVLDPDCPESIIGVLDWELAAVGDPLMDVGCSLGYWIEEADPDPMQLLRRLPTDLPGMPSRRELWERYLERSGRRSEAYDFYYCFGLFRLAAIAQQIYYRYHQGQTTDPRFAMLVFGVQVLDDTARAVAGIRPEV